MARGRRVVWGLSAFLAGVALVGAAAWWKVRGDWPTGVGPLRGPSSPWPAQADAREILADAAEAARGIDEPDPEGLLTRPTLPARPPAGGWPRHSRADAAFDALAAVTGFDALVPRRLTDPAPELRPVVVLAKLRLLRALERFTNGDAPGAAADVASVLHVAHRLQMAGGLVSTMVGIKAEEMALNVARAALDADPAARPALAAALVPHLEQARALPSAVARGLLGEAAMVDRTLADLGRLSADQLFEVSDGTAPTLPEPDGSAPAPRWLYDPDLTRAAARHWYQSWINAAAVPPAERAVPVPRRYWRDEWTALGQYLDNPVGRVLLEIARVQPGKYLAEEDALRQRRARLHEALTASSAP